MKILHVIADLESRHGGPPRAVLGAMRKPMACTIYAIAELAREQSIYISTRGKVEGTSFAAR